ncbi:GNAT family N-acetyltransferase [Paenibacillus motobuensis]|uniref:GNAT family N-acetyltransferase n=1 Tax=Paenibacillus motobuensis TaxID=295324 RepID=A0ABP3HXI9_9BACL
MDSKSIEELSLNHWPSLSTLLYDGWLLRFANGYTKRANSISPIYDCTYDLQLKIDECEKMYRGQQLPVIYKITPFVHPAHLDEVLAERGYLKHDMTSVQVLDLKHVRQPRLRSVKLSQEADLEWINDFCQMSQVGERHIPTMTTMLDNIKGCKTMISLYADSRAVACGFGVIEREYLGLFDIVTHPDYRNQGYAGQMILHLLQWGKQHGARYSYLAVVANNAPALRLYEKIGYSEIYKYWYRVKEHSPSDVSS